MAVSSDLSKEKAKIAKDAFSQIMEIYNREANPDMDNPIDANAAKLYADNVSDELFKYYRYKDGSQLEPFDIAKFKNRENEKTINSLHFQFNSKKHANQQIELYKKNGTGMIADLM